MIRQFFIVLVFYVSLTSCADRSHKAANDSLFENVAINDTKEYIDSICSKIWVSVPMHYKGRPTGQKDKYYYDERPVRDSLGNLKMYFVYDIASDTSEIDRRFYFYQRHLILALLMKARPRISMYFTTYYFRNDKPFCHESNCYPLLTEDSVLKLGQTYLSNTELRQK